MIRKSTPTGTVSLRAYRPRHPSPPLVLPPTVYRTVSWQADRITRVLGLPRDQADDIAGELNLRLAVALRRYDTAKGTIQAFTNAVLVQQYRAVIKRARADFAKHRATSMSSLREEDEPAARSATSNRIGGWTRDELRAALKRLPPDDLIFARLIANLSTRAVARAVGCHHGTVVRRKQRLLRQIRAAILEIHQEARTTCVASAEINALNGQRAHQEITHGQPQV
jgi:RNA polymerase sigma factor (sigma-70 family)